MRSLALPAFLLPFFCLAQEGAGTLLWRIEGNGLARPSYVVGTVHSRDSRAFVLVPQLLKIIAGQDALAGELDLMAVTGMNTSLAMDMMMPDGKDLEDIYSRRRYRVVQESLKEELGPMAGMAGRMKPFFLMALLGETAMKEDSSMVLDQYLQEKARSMGKEVLGLETVQEQLDAVDALPIEKQADMLYDLVRHDLYRKDMERMLDAYAAQDLDAIGRIAETGAMPKVFNARLITDRNKVMARRMDSLMTNGRTFLFAVGAGHLPGPGGLIAKLRAKGYRVSPVPPEAAGVEKLGTD